MKKENSQKASETINASESTTYRFAPLRLSFIRSLGEKGVREMEQASGGRVVRYYGYRFLKFKEADKSKWCQYYTIQAKTPREAVQRYYKRKEQAQPPANVLKSLVSAVAGVRRGDSDE